MHFLLRPCSAKYNYLRWKQSQNGCLGGAEIKMYPLLCRDWDALPGCGAYGLAWTPNKHNWHFLLGTVMDPVSAPVHPRGRSSRHGHTRRQQQQIWYRRMVSTTFHFYFGVTSLILTVCNKLVFCFLWCCSNTTELSALCLHASLIFFLTRCTVWSSKRHLNQSRFWRICVSIGNMIVVYHHVHHLSQRFQWYF